MKAIIFMLIRLSFICGITILMTACGNNTTTKISQKEHQNTFSYKIAPGDRINIFVWKNPDVSVSNIPVMPDGRISSPLVEDIIASGKTPTMLANEIERILGKYIRDPYVTVTVVSFVGEFSQQVRVIGEAAVPSAIPYRGDMTLLDIMIAVGGLTEYAAGNRAKIVRTTSGRITEIKVRLDDLVKGGDISANVNVEPGDIIVIPETLF